MTQPKGLVLSLREFDPILIKVGETEVKLYKVRNNKNAVKIVVPDEVEVFNPSLTKRMEAQNGNGSGTNETSKACQT
jgi:sRNA-binding carbon storage regulator CsrA